MQVGITGGIGAGKSLVCKIFQVLGAPVYNADIRARQLMEEDKILREEIATEFGDQSYQQGKLNRSYLSEIVFNNSEQVEKLNQLVHPKVGVDYQHWVTTNGDRFPYLIKEAALLVESGSYQQLDYLVTVSAPKDLRISRVLSRDPHRSKEQVIAIISKQLSEEVLISKSDRVLYNDERNPLIQQVLDLHYYLSSRPEGN